MAASCCLAANLRRNSVRFAHSGPSHCLLRPASQNSYPTGPSPCPCPGVDTSSEGCCQLSYSSRQMEKLLIENIVYMWLSGMQTPDFRTINIFRSKRLAGKFDGIFTQIVLLLHDEGLVSLKVQYIDGTKIESVANRQKQENQHLFY